MSKEFHLTMPISEEQIRELHVGDVVYLTGKIYTLRDMGHRRAVEMIKNGEADKIPFDLTNTGIYHCGPVVKQDENGKWQVVSAGPTTSSRFTHLGASLIRSLKFRVTLGKGTLFKDAVDAMQEVGSVFLQCTGGCAAYYSNYITEVEDVQWTDLGLPEAAWGFKIKDFGPFIVGIDSHGGSLYDSMREKVYKNYSEVCKRSNIDEQYNYSYLPKNILGRTSDERM